MKDFYAKNGVYFTAKPGIDTLPDYAVIDGHNIPSIQLIRDGYSRVSLTDDQVSHMIPNVDGSYTIPAITVIVYGRTPQSINHAIAMAKANGMDVVDSFSATHLADCLAALAEAKARQIVVDDFSQLGSTGRTVKAFLASLPAGTVVYALDSRQTIFADAKLTPIGEAFMSVLITSESAHRARTREAAKPAKTQADKDNDYLRAHAKVVHYLGMGLSLREVALLAKTSKSVVQTVARKIKSTKNQNA